MLFLIVVFVSLHCILVYTAKNTVRPVLLILLVCHFYYGLFGPLYWIYDQNAEFVGVYWGAAEIYQTAAVLSFSTLLVAGTIALLMRRVDSPAKFFSESTLAKYPLPLCWKVLAVIGFVSSLFVLYQGLSRGSADEDINNPLFLVAYQFSDILIPVIVYSIAKRGYRSSNLILIAYFFVFASLVGLRYKLALLILPLFIMSVLIDRSLTGWIKRAPMLLGALAWLSLLTIFRSKFYTPDLSTVGAVQNEDLLYGLFAETNILFGLKAIQKVYVDPGIYIAFQPITDAILDLIPRFLFPDRDTGDYLYDLLSGLRSEEGLYSATAYPFVGEFLMMFGWLGLFVGCLLYGSLYRLLHYLATKFGGTYQIAIAGIGLAAAIIGYYQYSRGYMSQALKAYIFVFAPYIYVSMVDKKNAMLMLSPRQYFQPPRRLNSRNATRDG